MVVSIVILGVSPGVIEELILALRSFAAGSLFAEVLGDGSPRILALHGWGRRGADFKPSLEGLPALAPDLPGFGVSPAPGEAIGAQGYARIVSQVLEEFDGPPVLIGHSFGGRVALCLAARYPDRVGPLVLTGVPVLRVAETARLSPGYRAIRLLNRWGVVSDTRLEALRRRSGSADYRAARGVMRDILVKVINESYQDELTAVTGPITFLWGADDTEVPPLIGERAVELRRAAGLPSKLSVIEGVGHHLPIQAPDQLRRVVAGMLV
jgi:pimeloyl-ACP methyl ester carboxylesterase